MRVSIFDFNSPVDYLIAALGAGQRGTKADLARRLDCHTSFISQVLSEKTALSVEHAMKVSEFFAHSNEERTFLVLLIHKSKAGSRDAKNFYQSQIDELRSRRQPIRDSILVTDELSDEQKGVYYSSWWHAAIHVLVAFGKLNSPEKIAKHLGLNINLVNQSLDFLVKNGLVVQSSVGFSIGKTRIHIGPTNPLVARHHSNWRLKAIEAQEKFNASNLHYSGIIGISLDDAQRIRTSILKLLQDSEQILSQSKEEQAYVMLIDFFDL